MLQPLQYETNEHVEVCLLKSYLIYEIKKKTTNKLCKKSCLMIQGYNDTEKTTLLTQTPTIQ